MAKYCMKCGKPLEEGKECACGMKKEADTFVQVKYTANNYMNLFLEIIKAMMKTPVDAIKKYAIEKNFKFSMVAILLNALIFGLFFYCLLKEGTNNLGFNSLMISRFEVSFIKTLLLGALLIIVGFIITISMIYVLAGSLFKAKVNFRMITSMVGICSTLMTVVLAISIIIVFLSIKLAFIILLIASMFYLVYLCQGIMEITNIEKNKLAYVFVPTVLVTLFVVVYIVPRILF